MAIRLPLVGALRYIGSRTSVVSTQRQFSSQKKGGSTDTIRVRTHFSLRYINELQWRRCYVQDSLIIFYMHKWTWECNFLNL